MNAVINEELIGLKKLDHSIPRLDKKQIPQNFKYLLIDMPLVPIEQVLLRVAQLKNVQLQLLPGFVLEVKIRSKAKLFMSSPKLPLLLA